MGLYADHVVPRLVDVVLSGAEFGRIRARVCAALTGDVLEIGFGSGLNVAHYPSAVRQVRAVDPAVVGRKLAAKRVAASSVEVSYIGLDGQSLPLDDGSVDDALSTWTMCTIPDAEQALAELRRVLRPGGRLHFAEHGRSPDPAVARWQDRLTPVQRRVAGGCHLNRRIDHLIEASGLEIDKLDNYYLRGPKVGGYMFEGVAIKR